MKIRRKRRKSEDEETSYWLSYSDMMAGLLLVFVLIISFTILQAKSQYETKEEELAEQALIIYAMQEDIASKQGLLDDQQTQLDDQQTQLDDQQTQLDEQQTELDAAKLLLADKEAELEGKQTELDEQKSAVEVMKELLAQQQLELEDKEATVQSQQEELAAQQEQLDRIIGVKADLIEALRNKFEETNLKVSVDSDTGAITLDSSILFATDDFSLTEEGEILLTQFIPIYISVLMSPEFRDNVSEIIIEGHTDTEGTYEYNLELSQQRALAVAAFCLSEDNSLLDAEGLAALRSILTANGRSFSDPVYDEYGQIDMDASRRVEFKFRLNDEEMVQEMIDILNEKTQEEMNMDAPVTGTEETQEVTNEDTPVTVTDETQN